MNGANVSAVYLGNDITGDAYNIFGFSLGDVESNVTGNNVVLAGNYTTGIAYRGSNLVVDNNIISAKGSNVGNESIWEGFGVQNIGIKVVKGTSTITNNNIQTTGDSAINLTNNKAKVKDNYLAGAKGVGNNAVAEAENATVSSNTPEYKIILASPRVYTQYADGVVYVVMAYDENGIPLENITLFSTVNNMTYNATTDDEGYAAFVVDLDAGYYVAKTSFEGNEKYGPKDISTPITVDASASAIKASSSVTVLLTKVKSGYNFKLTLVDMKGNGLANKKVSITFNGKTKTYTTNSAGVISYKLSATKTGSYKLTMKFAGDNNYAKSSATSTIKLTKEASKLTAAKKTFKAKTKTKKYTVTLKDSKKKAIKKVKVTLKVKGKTYKATTNAKGKATFKITKLTKAGSYKATVKFAGNAYYKASTKSVKITVKK
ncbi:Ig-like domain repeat protein [uncultured Methanobrevibacter sp.]|uniref:Ig-like domain repeat protein n=1 Tax=uncultured Methanobrevibacter sp. TaxID=253161 RepID=UPI0025E4448A|nr:Ig-like domain repeat protein [uncultured Methanobrevibacter sp.]